MQQSYRFMQQIIPAGRLPRYRRIRVVRFAAPVGPAVAGPSPHHKAKATRKENTDAVA